MAKDLDEMMTPHEAGIALGSTAGTMAGMVTGQVMPALFTFGAGYVVGRAGQHFRRYTQGGPSVQETIAEGNKRHPALNDKQNWNGK
jgi:hypothetical protein